MAAAKVAVTIEEELLRELDDLVQRGEFPNRSRAITAAVVCLKQQRQRKQRLLAELAKLDPIEERAIAEEMMRAGADWPDW